MAKEVLLILMYWVPSKAYLERLAQISPGIEIKLYQNSMYDKEIPKDITPEIWAEVTVLLTWKLLPSKEQVPNLRYVQLISAGCNQILGLPIFEETDIAFCTANGIHP